MIGLFVAVLQYATSSHACIETVRLVHGACLLHAAGLRAATSPKAPSVAASF